MKNALKLFFYLTLILLCYNCSNQESIKADYNVVPRPTSILSESGAPFCLKSNVQICYADNDTVMKQTAFLLKEYIKEQTGNTIRVVAQTQCEENKPTISLALTGYLEDRQDSYQIYINKERIELRSSSEEGLFYAVQTLRKSMPQHKGDFYIKFHPVLITDSPFFPYRGALLDVSRHKCSISQIKQFIDIMAINNMNYLHLLLNSQSNWRIESLKYPSLTAVFKSDASDSIRNSEKGYYSQNQIREIVDYASQRFIKIIPEINIPDLLVKELERSQKNQTHIKSNYSLDSDQERNDSTIIVLNNILDEITMLFPSEYIHIGNNEHQPTNCPHDYQCENNICISRENADSENKTYQTAFNYILNKIEQHLSLSGRHILRYNNGNKQQWGSNISICFNSNNQDINAIQRNKQVILAPSELYLGRCQLTDTTFIQEEKKIQKIYQYNLFPHALTPGQKEYIIGGEGSLRGRYLLNDRLTCLLLPKMGALAETLWCNPEQKDYDDFIDRMQRMHYLYDMPIN